MNKLNANSAIFIKPKYNYILIIILITLISCVNQNKDFTVISPEGRISVLVNNKNDIVNYTLLKDGESLIASSEISIFSKGSRTRIIGSNLNNENKTWKPVWGQFSEIKDQYNELVLDLQIDESKAKLYVRVYDNGIGFRYVLEDYKEGIEVNYYCEYNLNDNNDLYCTAGEKTPLGPITLKTLNTVEKQPKLMMPIVIESSKKSYLSLLESDLYSAPEFGVIKFSFDKTKKILVSSNKIKFKGNSVKTPWRVILINDAIGDLVTNTVSLNLATPNKIENPSWIQSGTSLWDFRVHGYKAKDGFTYGTNTESYKRFIDFAEEVGLEYFLIDATWYPSVTQGKFKVKNGLDIEEVSRYAANKKIKLILYYDRKKGAFGDDELFPYYQKLGMSGIKYGFMGHNVSFTSEAIEKSAENNLLIDFHDSPVPFTGIERTFPNAITKEYCHAQQDCRKAFTPETFIKMGLINAIQGPLDMTNGNFDLIGINKNTRKRGPKKTQSYFSTVASEAARVLIIYSGLACLPDAPESYRAKADIFEFIQKLPIGKWDESKVLHAKMGDYISTARRHGEEWFIGSVYNQKGGTLLIELDFLKEGQNYEITYYEDTLETDCRTNPEAYQVRKSIVKKGDAIKAIMAPGGGHCMWIRPKS